MDLLDGLNEAQKTAVLHDQGPLLIVAGAGTGKTTVITRKITKLILEHKALPNEILALTFTDKAAGEMQTRVESMLPFFVYDLSISTFHSFCQDLVGQYGFEIGLPVNFKIMETTGAWQMLYRNVDKLQLEYFRTNANPYFFLKKLLTHFARLKDELISPETYLRYAQNYHPHDDESAEAAALNQAKYAELARCFSMYNQLLLENNSLDFEDIINYSVALLEQRPNITQTLKSKYKYIFIDEFQDTNRAQYELIKLLASQTSNLCVVGDDDQSIYKFRGASISNILKFQTDYPNLSQVTLVENYRSKQNILDMSYKLIQNNNPDRLEEKLHLNKRLISKSPGEGSVTLASFESLDEEVTALVQEIKQVKLERPSLSWNEFAILVRSNSQAKELLPALDAAFVPYIFLASQGLFATQIIYTIISYIRVLLDLHDTESLYNILQLDNYRLSSLELSGIAHILKKKPLSLYECLQSPEISELLGPESKTRIEQLLEQLKVHAEMTQTSHVCEMLVAIIQELGLLEHLGSSTEQAAKDRELVEQFYKQALSYERENENKTVRGFVDFIDLQLASGDEGKLKFDPDKGPEALKIMTVHGSKGLEFECVFLPQMVMDKFPGRNMGEGITIPDELLQEILPQGNFHLQEERRLGYVAITRARSVLYLSYASDYGGKRARKPSLFLSEMGVLDLTNEKAHAKPSGKISFEKSEKIPAKKYEGYIPETFSYSAITKFEDCPMEYKLKYYLSLPLPGSPALSYGNSVHKTLELFMKQYRTGAQLTLEDLIAIYKKEFIDEWYQTKNSREKLFKDGLIVMKNFFDHTQREKPQVLMLEEKFKLPLGDYHFVGKIDRVDKFADGVRVIDYKTGSIPTKKHDADQLLIYQWALETLEQKPLSLTYWYLSQDVFKEVPIVDADGIQTLKSKLLVTIEKIVETIRTDSFGELDSSLSGHTCDYKNLR